MAERVTDGGTLERLAARYAREGWPATVQDGAFTHEYSAPSAGLPPWDLYAVAPKDAEAGNAQRQVRTHQRMRNAIGTPAHPSRGRGHVSSGHGRCNPS